MRLILFSILLSFGYGKIVFIPHSINGGEKGILSIHATDINGDGNTDLLFSSIESNSITWLENKGNTYPSIYGIAGTRVIINIYIHK